MSGEQNRIDTTPEYLDGPLQRTVQNYGPDTVYYGTTQGVSSTSNTGSIAAGSTTTLTAAYWIVSAGRSIVLVTEQSASTSTGVVAYSSLATGSSVSAGKLVEVAGVVWQRIANGTIPAAFTGTQDWRIVAPAPADRTPAVTAVRSVTLVRGTPGVMRYSEARREQIRIINPSGGYIVEIGRRSASNSAATTFPTQITAGQEWVDTYTGDAIWARTLSTEAGDSTVIVETRIIPDR